MLLIESFELRAGSIKTVFGNTTDLFEYRDVQQDVRYLTPREEAGTVSITNGTPNLVGVGTTFTNLKPGDQIHVGATTQRDPAAIWYEVLSVTNDLNLVLTTNYAETTAAGVAWTGRILFSGIIQNPWVAEPFYNGSALGGPSPTGDRLYLCNQIDEVVAWDGAIDQVYTPALANVQTCRHMKQHKNKMIFVAPTVSGTFAKYSIRTSDVGKPEDTVNGEAVELIVHDGPDELLAAFPIGEQLAIYAKESVTIAQSVALPLVYVFRTVINDYGPLSPRGIAVYPDFHDFIARDREYRFNGAGAVPINDHVWRDVIRQITPERNFFLHHHFIDEEGELVWCVPLTSDADTTDGSSERAYITQFMEDVGERNPEAHTLRELPALVFGNYLRDTTLTWNQIQQQWQNFNYRWNDRFFFAQFPLTLFGDEAGDIFVYGGSTDKNGTAMDSFARFARVATGNVEQSAVIRRIYPYLEQIAGSTDLMTVRLYGTDTPDGIASLLSTQTLSRGMNTSTRFVSPRQSARYVEVWIGQTAERAYWGLAGYSIDTAPGAGR